VTAELRTGGDTGPLSGLRVVEIGDELVEYCGLVLAGLGAEVVKIEPPSGAPSRSIGPFYGGEPDPERSLFFWAYNRGKRSVVIDLDDPAGRTEAEGLIAGADIVLDGTPGRALQPLGLDAASLRRRHPALVIARMTPFGDDGPWADFHGSDLIHLALGGVLMNCGYDPDPLGRYDLPPFAPQVFHAYHIAGEQLAFSIIAAVIYRNRSGDGQIVSCAVHEACAKNTETDLMSWVMMHQPFYRQAARHSGATISAEPTIAHTKDGRWVTAIGFSSRDRKNLGPFLDRWGMAGGLVDATLAAESGGRFIPGSSLPDEDDRPHIQRFVRRFIYDEVPWHEAQQAGLLWSPIRKPEENAVDEHWLERGTFADVEHPEIGRTLRYPTSKWLSTAPAWVVGRRAPLLGEDAGSIEPRQPVQISVGGHRAPEGLSRHGKPFALSNIKVFDFTWFLASAGGTRFLAALGADVIKVEWKHNPDSRYGGYPVGGREARASATAPLKAIPPDPDMGGQFNNKNPGKRGISLNIRHPKGLEMAKAFIEQCDIVAEGFSPGVMDRVGLGWDVLRSINPSIIYAQQSGMGALGRYGRYRAIGPIAGSLSGLTEMGGLPDPAPPSGWGYSYLDWMGAYSLALALVAAIHHRDRTGEGQYIDASQTEVGIYLTALSVLDWSANGTEFQRFGNRSPYKPAAPHGVYRCSGDDHWLAIGCFTEEQWRALVDVAGHPEWAADPRFATLDSRLRNQDALDALVQSWTVGEERYAAMDRLQRAGVAAGVAQTAEDRCEADPQLRHLNWLTELDGTKIGTWPLAEVPIGMSETPTHIGGRIDRAAPCYGEHNYEVFEEFLGLSHDEVDALAEEGVI
jgi:crotonobetainyl-CoA:carnitine CoA-transferase CaiB-like acyl-CoA transferase